MRYEVRRLDGKLVGTLSCVLPPSGRFVAQHLPKANPRWLGAPGHPACEEIVLEPDSSVFRGKPIPTLVITKGKQTWLKGYPGFSRV